MGLIPSGFNASGVGVRGMVVCDILDESRAKRRVEGGRPDVGERNGRE